MNLQETIKKLEEEEAKELYPDYQPNTAFNPSRQAERVAHVKARLLSVQAIIDAFAAGANYMSDVVSDRQTGCGIDEPDLEQYLSTHIPPLVDLELLISDAWKAAEKRVEFEMMPHLEKWTIKPMGEEEYISSQLQSLK